MIIKDILKETTAIVCGRIDQKENNVEKMLGMMEYNFPVLDACHSVVLVLNRGSDVSEKEITEIASAYKSKFKISYILQPHPVGMGHQVGHVTLDKTGYLFAKNNLGTKYTMKVCNDILISDRFLDLEIEQADFYYLPGVGMRAIIEEMDVAKKQLLEKNGYADHPLACQTWFFITSHKTDVIYESDEEIQRVFRTWNATTDPYQNNILCAEHSLTKWASQNNLTRHSLYNISQFDNYCQFVVRNRLMDGSLKNVTLEPIGITHYHFAGRPLTQCNL
jgi:hypothetical protein